MIVSFVVAVYFQLVHVQVLGLTAWDPSLQLVVGVLLTTVGWVTVTFMTEPAAPETLRSFHDLIQPMGPGWRGSGLDLQADMEGESPAAAFLAWFLGCTVVYGAVLGTGNALYGRGMLAIACFGAAAVAAVALLRTLPRVGLR